MLIEAGLLIKHLLAITGFNSPKLCRYVGVIATFERQILLPKNGRNQKDGSLVISLQYPYFSVKIFIADILR